MGRPVRYNGTAKTLIDRHLDSWRAQDRLVIFCPEVAAGLPTPRAPAEIVAGATAADVLNGTATVLEDNGKDVGDIFREAAQMTVAHAKRHGCHWALLTDGSPSCGTSFIYSGQFDGMQRDGKGVVAEALLAHGIGVFAPAEIDQLANAVRGAT